MSTDLLVARRVAVATVANVAGQAVVVIGLIVLAPIIVHAVGATDYGAWVLIGSVASFGFLLELGISAALVKYVAEHAARGEIEDAALMVGAATWLYAALGAILAAAGLMVALLLPAVVSLHGALARLLPPLALLIGLDIGISVLAIAPLAVLKGLQRFPAVSVINGAGALTGVVLTIAVLSAGAGIVGVAAVGAANSALTYGASLLVARRIVPEYLAAPVHLDPARVGRLLRFSRSIAVIQVGTQLQTRLDAVVIGAALPIRLITPYNFAQRLAAGTAIATDQFGKVLLPLATEVGATREPAALRSLFLTATRLTLAIAIGVGLPIALLGGPILRLWVGEPFAGYGGVVALLAAAAIIDLPSNPAAFVLQSIERHGPIAVMALGSGLANLTLSIAFVGPYGITGVAAATLIASTVEITVFVVPYAARTLGVSLGELVAEVIARLALPALGLAGLLLGGAAIVPITSLLRLALVVVCAVGGYVLLYVILGAGPMERAVFRSGATAVASRAFRRQEPDPGTAQMEMTSTTDLGKRPLAATALICTRERPRMLREAVDSLLAARTVPRELLIVDQSKERNAELAALGTVRGCHVRYVQSDTEGLSRGRNLGFQLATQDAVIILHDDMLILDDSLEQLLIGLVAGEPGRAVATGRMLAAPPDGPGLAQPPAALFTSESPALFRGRQPRQIVPGGNFAVPRAAVLRIGGYDTRLGPGTRFPAAEDADLSLRLLDAGYEVRHVPEAIVLHRSWRSQADMVRLRWAYATGQGAFYAKHASLRDRYVLRRAARELRMRGRRAVRAALRSPKTTAAELTTVAGILFGAVDWMLRYRLRGG